MELPDILSLIKKAKEEVDENPKGALSKYNKADEGLQKNFLAIKLGEGVGLTKDVGDVGMPSAYITLFRIISEGKRRVESLIYKDIEK